MDLSTAANIPEVAEKWGNVNVWLEINNAIVGNQVAEPSGTWRSWC